MLLWFLQWLSGYYHALNVVEYLTMRTILSVLTSLIISLILGPTLIRKLTSYKVGQSIRSDGPQSHLVKSGTPTMGGGLILIAITLTTLLWANLTSKYIWIVLLVTLGFGLIGLCDDYKKLVLKNSKGLSAKKKYLSQSVIALVAACYLYFSAQSPAETALIIPFFKNIAIPMGLFYIVLAYFVIVGTSNAVNLTDGLDGLATLPTVFIAAGLGVFAYLSGNINFSSYLAIPYVPGVGELVVFCAAIIGAGLGFLWFNTYPAQVFMGDVGSLSLGAALGIIAILVRQELILLIMGGIFVAETVSVILQVASFRLTGKRIFRMAPLHHHFELKGWAEPKIIVRFWIISLVLVLCSLATLKLR
tara:strand:+ start:14295 stop:15377 length:1083 start_codon:yes stop_codon:yes gene_type:complete